MEWLPITYRGSWDVPRIFVVVVDGGDHLLWSEFRDDRDEYSDRYRVVVLDPDALPDPPASVWTDPPPGRRRPPAPGAGRPVALTARRSAAGACPRRTAAEPSADDRVRMCVRAPAGASAMGGSRSWPG